MGSSRLAETTWDPADGVHHMPETDPRIPFAVVWTSLPLISWLFPFIGHVGITTSQGIVTDFAGPYHVTVGSMMCGPPRRVWRLDIADATSYDEAVYASACFYGKRMHK